VRLTIGDPPGYFVVLPGLSYQGFPELPMLAQAEPLSRTLVERVSVAVSQLELDVFVISLHGSWADPEFLRDPAGPEPGAS